ncbi:Dehydrodolichyl diphosphate synthase CPT3-like protein [Drosera capensis]
MGLGTKLRMWWWNCVDRLQIIVNPFSMELVTLLLKLMYSILSVGPLPNHMAFIMDGNRRYAKKHKLKEVESYQNGSSTLLSTLKYCSELSIKYITVYAFSIDNFKRSPEDVKFLMDLMLVIMERLIADESFIKEHGVRICFAGNLRLLNEPVRVAAEKIVTASADNTKTILLICVAYTSTDEIVHAVQETCLQKTNEAVGSDVYKEKVPIIGLADIEKHMYMAQAPEPDVLVRTSGESRLSNFLLWQTRSCLLYNPAVLWPEFGFRHLVWAMLNYQRHYRYLEKKKKQD